ncbi:MAG: hypothetical protein JNK94_05475 [Hyphomonadaceae bacterium]|nr:hypothetical protein [Hyphomonadaceae bacterium]
MKISVSRRALLASSFGLPVLSASAVEPLGAPAPITLVAAADRDGADLSGAWRYSIDPYRDGLVGFHGAAAGFGHRRFDEFDVESYSRAHPKALIEYDMARAETCTLPRAWLAHTQSMRHYVGLVWYQRRFRLDALGARRAFIYVEAANYRANVYVNGNHVGVHEGGFTPFACEVTHVLRDGDNQITLGVDSEPSADTVPPLVTDWENYGGVTRPVRLVITPSTFIDDAWIRLTRDGAIAASIRLSGARAANRRVRVRVPALALTLEGRTGADGCWTGAAPAPAELARWSPDSPTLCDVSFEGAGDALRDRVGFRTIETRGEDILLNGEPIFLRGICLHEEEIGAEPARRMTAAAAEQLLRTAKDELHCNFVRLAHYPHAAEVTRAADALGLLVWSEIPVYWRINWDNNQTLAAARNMLAENIRRDRNRASIAFWSVANETPPGASRDAFLRTLIADVRALDDTRLVTAALLTDRVEEGGRPIMTLNDPLAEHLDVLGVNTYNGWYSDDALADLPRISWRSPYGKPMIFSEFGADALAGFSDPELLQKFSEDFQSEYYRQTLAMSTNISFLRGLAPWILKDFRSPRRQHPVFQRGWNRKGVMSETGVRKQAFAVLAAHYDALRRR